ncbi:MAG: dihydrolipoyllysine-residue succinyltransferase [Zetaproteobacteria bacterium]|nr:MAG: dihydrolipoyllysine-residue succinyltransferase [Zetaproteobacteria bacterium]
MMIEIKVPALGESESEATLVSWAKQVGDAVAVDDVLAEVESDKITLEITALDAGVLRAQHKQAGDVVAPGEVIGLIEPGVEAAASPAEAAEAPGAPSAPTREVSEAPSTGRSATAAAVEAERARREAPQEAQTAPEQAPPEAAERLQERRPMSRLRKRIATRLKQAQNSAAMLTTFNEVDMQAVIDLRTRYRDQFQASHGVGLGFMSFFLRAAVIALARYPVLNAYIDGDDVVYHNYADIGVAVSTDRGLVVPVVRDAGTKSLAELERAVAELARKAREGGLMPEDLQGGTFSITNGGVFGSLLSTPILNPPQSAILGMHAIKKRPVVVQDQVVIRPMMYLALTYDHRLIDGKEAVQFLVAVKEAIEMPAAQLLDL